MPSLCALETMAVFSCGVGCTTIPFNYSENSNGAASRNETRRMKTILITGAAGDVGTHLRRELAGHYHLKVSDLRSLKKINKEEKFVRADISKFSDALRI